MRVDQVIPTLAARDAVGVHTLAITDALRGAGIESDIYYGACPTPEIAHLGHPVSRLGRGGRHRWLLYQASIGSPTFELVAARPEPKLVNYHNITPAALLDSWEPSVGYELVLGRDQLRRLAPETHLAVADSGYNEAELLAAGYARTEVVSLLIDMTGSRIRPDERLLGRLREEKEGGGADLLFVGKVSAHKAPHDLVKMLAVLRRLYDPEARLHLVGSPLGQRYATALLGFIERLGLEHAVRITGSVTQQELEAYYRTADAFVCASEHEGFCVPIIESMAHGIPVVAFASTAVPETVHDAGILLDDKEPMRFAAAVARVLDDRALAEHLDRAGRRRADHFSLEHARQRMLRAVTGAVGHGGAARSAGDQRRVLAGSSSRRATTT